MLDKAVAAAAEALVLEVKSSFAYQEYMDQLLKIKAEPALYEKVNEYRSKNYQLQTQEPAEGLLEKIDRFEQEYETLLEQPLVNDFLRAELAFCRMMQEVDVCIAEEMDFG